MHESRCVSPPLDLEELTLDAPRVGELAVDVKACAICQSGITYIAGGYGGTLPRALRARGRRHRLRDRAGHPR